MGLVTTGVAVTFLTVIETDAALLADVGSVMSAADFVAVLLMVLPPWLLLTTARIFKVRPDPLGRLPIFHRPEPEEYVVLPDAV